MFRKFEDLDLNVIIILLHTSAARVVRSTVNGFFTTTTRQVPDFSVHYKFNS